MSLAEAIRACWMRLMFRVRSAGFVCSYTALSRDAAAVSRKPGSSMSRW